MKPIQGTNIRLKLIREEKRHRRGKRSGSGCGSYMRDIHRINFKLGFSIAES